MNWKLIFKLSMFALAMGFLTIYLVPPNIESVLWLIIFITCSYLIAIDETTKKFLTGFMVSIVNSIWVTTAHLLFFDLYTENHPEEMQLMAEIGLNTNSKLTMLITGVVIGITSGIILGLFSVIASRLMKRG